MLDRAVATATATTTIVNCIIWYWQQPSFNPSTDVHSASANVRRNLRENRALDRVVAVECAAVPDPAA